jgi:hypothetical protein
MYEEMADIHRSCLLAVVIAGMLVSYPSSSHAQTGQADRGVVRAGRFDGGKMWTFEDAPREYFADTYGVAADDAWFERARMAALRIPGCSASYVSPRITIAFGARCRAPAARGKPYWTTGFTLSPSTRNGVSQVTGRTSSSPSRTSATKCSPPWMPRVR